MFGFFKGKPTPEFDVPVVGRLYQYNDGGIGSFVCWHAVADIFSIGQKIDISIDTLNEQEPTAEHIRAIQSITTQYDNIWKLIFDYLMVDDSTKVTIENFKQMYRLTAVELNINVNNWTYVFEPVSGVLGRNSNLMIFNTVDGKVANYYET